MVSADLVLDTLLPFRLDRDALAQTMITDLGKKSITRIMLENSPALRLHLIPTPGRRGDLIENVKGHYSQSCASWPSCEQLLVFLASAPGIFLLESFSASFRDLDGVKTPTNDVLDRVLARARP